MSYCEIITFKEGKPNDQIEFKNSWGGAAYIWTALFDKYLKDPENTYDTWLSRFGKDQGKCLWDLAGRKDLKSCERAVHISTFDYATVRKENFPIFVHDLKDFIFLHPNSKESVCHLPEWAKFIESCREEAIGFYGTSVSENPWFGYNEENDEIIPYNLNSGTKHFEIYEYLKELDNQQKGENNVKRS
jgi:hypothetical protein